MSLTQVSFYRILLRKQDKVVHIDNIINLRDSEVELERVLYTGTTQKVLYLLYTYTINRPLYRGLFYI